MGHGAKRCPEPPKDEGAGGGLDSATGGGFNDGFDAGHSGGEAWETGGGANNEASWAAAPVETTAIQVGGW